MTMNDLASKLFSGVVSTIKLDYTHVLAPFHHYRIYSKPELRCTMRSWRCHTRLVTARCR